MNKEYTNNEITVVWEPGKCIHSAMCVKGLPEVFDAKKKPWINISGSESAKIVAQVRRCPSGALSIKGDSTEKSIGFSEAVIAGSSPVMVKLESGKNYAWCACGKSSNQPWCDGSHKSTNIKPVIFKTDDSASAAMCMCKRSGNKPYCDGSHARLGG